jgi:hypothetical protein
MYRSRLRIRSIAVRYQSLLGSSSPSFNATFRTETPSRASVKIRLTRSSRGVAELPCGLVDLATNRLERLLLRIRAGPLDRVRLGCELLDLDEATMLGALKPVLDAHANAKVRLVLGHVVPMLDQVGLERHVSGSALPHSIQRTPTCGLVSVAPLLVSAGASYDGRAVRRVLDVAQSSNATR